MNHAACPQGSSTEGTLARLVVVGCAHMGVEAWKGHGTQTDLSGLGAWNPLLTLLQGTTHSPLYRAHEGHTVLLGMRGNAPFPL